MPGAAGLLAPSSPLLALTCREEKLFHIVEQKLLRFGLPQVQAVVVDELLLGLEPFTPAHATDSLVGATA